MFDDQTPNVAPPANLPSEPDDMFADVDKIDSTAPSAPNALQAGVLKPKMASATPVAPAAMPSVMTTPQMYSVKEPVVGKIILIVVLLVVFGIAGYFGYRLYSSDFFAPKTAQVAPAASNVAPVVVPPVVEETPPVVETAPEIVSLPTTTVQAATNMASDAILFGEGVDSDKDGLDDVREQEIGTDPFKTDSDGDGLSDGDEVIIWKTDPLNKDTDGDKYLDGEEVKNGYNPLGPGKLFNVPTTTKK